MNINDIKAEIPEVTDRLDAIFEGQRRLMGPYKEIAEGHWKKVFGVDVKIPDTVWQGGEHNLHSKAGNAFIVDMMNAAIHELSEAVQVMKNWKPWKQTEMATDVQHYKEEMIDALHFYVEACILAGMDAQEVFELYYKKHAVNQFRQRTNY